jgi:RecJ-like exonuclease
MKLSSTFETPQFFNLLSINNERPKICDNMPPKVLILTHGDTDGVCAAAIAKASCPEAEVEFINPSDLVLKLESLSGYDRVIILDLGIDRARKAEAMTAFQKLSRTSSIIYIDHHLRPPGVTERSLACNGMMHKANASTSELAWRFFKPPPSHDFITVLGATGDYQEKTPQMRKLVEKYGERKVYPEALFLEWALAVSEDSFKREVIEELVKGRWPLSVLTLEKRAAKAVRRRRKVEKHVREKAEKICERVMLVRDVPFEATGLAAHLLTKRDNIDVGIGASIVTPVRWSFLFQEEPYVRLSMRRHIRSDINLASLIGECTSRVGGAGGGHEAAAGGKVPVQRFDEFLQEIRRKLIRKTAKKIKKN